MKIKSFLSKELECFSLFEKIFFPTVIIFLIFSSFILKDDKIALISAICGTSYSFLAGKGKISCYYVGALGTFCYCYIAYKNTLFGNLALYALFYFPMYIIGYINWSKNLNKKSRSIIKTHLSKKEKLIYFPLMFILIILFNFVLITLGGKLTFIDSITTICSIFGQILTVKRCYEQWYIWIIVNVLTLIMWIIAYANGSNCFATVIMWFIYTFFAFYFLINWRKELISNEDNI
ncbi:MAG: nicotinamide mononucleotide transporter [Candidatus Gastranaerophilales bacterium]|nr:nicotinamide mononucleotide transporter [Candidatus Gastranaerophilales bacterium]